VLSGWASDYIIPLSDGRDCDYDFKVFSGLVPYPESKEEIQVITRITKGIPPNGQSQLERVEELGGTPVPDDSHWLTNGTWASILRCWNQNIAKRPTASQFLQELSNRSQMPERPMMFDNWAINGVVDLTGGVKKLKARGYGPTLGWSRGVWRYVDWARGQTIMCLRHQRGVWWEGVTNDLHYIMVLEVSSSSILC
jgi:hypothetical protein